MRGGSQPFFAHLQLSLQQFTDKVIHNFVRNFKTLKEGKK